MNIGKITTIIVGALGAVGALGVALALITGGITVGGGETPDNYGGAVAAGVSELDPYWNEETGGGSVAFTLPDMHIAQVFCAVDGELVLAERHITRWRFGTGANSYSFSEPASAKPKCAIAVYHADGARGDANALIIEAGRMIGVER